MEFTFNTIGADKTGVERFTFSCTKNQLQVGRRSLRVPRYRKLTCILQALNWKFNEALNILQKMADK